MIKKVLPGAGPFYFNGTKIGVLLFHGFGGGTCADLRYIAESIYNRKGYTLHLPLLPGFGTNPKDLKEVKLSDWLENIETSFSYIRQKCEKVIVGGHSIGGVIPYVLAKTHKIDGIFSLSAPIGIRGIAPIIAPFMGIFKKYHNIGSEQFICDTGGKWVGYDKIPINIVGKIKNLIALMRDNLTMVTCPVLLLQGKKDDQIKKRSMDYIYQNIQSAGKRKIWLENNGHPILDSPDQNIIINELINFIEKIKNKEKLE
ncbi:MAG: alpha/beta fold hydrolase [Candidatus Lokiarchaeota archaeon]|jgi:carboxylesterase